MARLTLEERAREYEIARRRIYGEAESGGAGKEKGAGNGSKGPKKKGNGVGGGGVEKVREPRGPPTGTGTPTRTAA